MRFLKIISFILFSLLLSFKVYSQDNGNDKKGNRVLTTDTIPELDLNPDSAANAKKKKKKKKKVKKKVFYGLKCRKGFTRSGLGENGTMELFFYLKKYKEPNFYVPEIYVWDITTRKIKKVSEIKEQDKPNIKIIHGPYKKYVSGNVVEEGIFYVGTKHARWEEYNSKFILIGKTKYDKGWPREAKISYYDRECTKMKEVIPYNYGRLEGDYYYFFENGQVSISGQYENGVKVGLWIEYFEGPKHKRLRETKYADDCYDKIFQPIIMKEWDEQGNIVIDEGKKISPEERKSVENDPIKKHFKKGRH